MNEDDETLNGAIVSDWNPQRGPDGKFLPGQGGKPRGAKNALASSTMRRIKEMTPAALEQLEKQLNSGNWDACRFVLERIIGKNNRFIELSGDRPSDISDALVNGEISTDEAKAIATVIEKLKKVEEIDAVMTRMDELERLLKG